MYSSKLLPLFALMLFALLHSGCTAGTTRGAAVSLDDLAGADLTAMDDQSYAAACKRICGSTGQAYTSKTPRSEGPKLVLARQNGVLVLSGDAKAWSLVAVDTSGKRQWKASVELGEPVVPGTWAIIQVQDIAADILVCKLDGQESLASLAWGLTEAGPLLVRAVDKAGRVASARVSAEHPQLSLAGGSIESSDPVKALAALLALTQPVAKAERHRPSVRATVEAMASGTNRWLAEAAAQLLIQP